MSKRTYTSLKKLYPKMWRSKRLRKKLKKDAFEYICKKRKPKDFSDFIGCYFDAASDHIAKDMTRKNYLLEAVEKDKPSSSGWVVPFEKMVGKL